MADNFIQNIMSQNLQDTLNNKYDKPEKYEKLYQAKEYALTNNPDQKIINMATDEPDAMADVFVVETLSREASRWENRTKSANDSKYFNEAAGDYLKNIFSVEKINPTKQICPTNDIEHVLTALAAAFIDPGDYSIIASPFTTGLGIMTKFLGGNIYKSPLNQENGFLPDLDDIPVKITKRAKILYLNYPNNPTGASATKDFFEQAVSFAKKNNIIIINDASNAPYSFDGNEPTSYLSVKGAKKVGVEAHSLKAFNLSGWRIGFLAGNEYVINAYNKLSNQMGYGQFNALTLAGKYALEHPEIIFATSEKYSRRHDYIIKALTLAGFEAVKPKSTYYLFVKIPKGIKNGIRFTTAEDFSQYLLKEKSIFAVPFDEIGGYVRFSLTFQAFGQDEEQLVATDLYNRLSTVDFEF